MQTSSKTLALFLVALFILGPAAALGQDATTTDDDRPGAKRPGFYLAFDVSGATYDLDDAVGDRLAASGVDLSRSANGGAFYFGYSWRNEFALELQLIGANISAGDADIEAGLGQFNVGVHVPLLPRHRVAPYLAGHLGGTALGFEGRDVNDRIVFGGNTGVGAGIEVHLGRRWALDFGYQFTLVNFGSETIEIDTGETVDVEIDGSGRIHRWAIRTTFSF